MMWVWLVVALFVGAALGLLTGAMLHAAAGADLAAKLQRLRLRLEVGHHVMLDARLGDLIATVDWAADDGRLGLGEFCPEPDTVVRLMLDDYRGAKL